MFLCKVSKVPQHQIPNILISDKNMSFPKFAANLYRFAVIHETLRSTLHLRKCWIDHSLKFEIIKKKLLMYFICAQRVLRYHLISYATDFHKQSQF